MSKIIKGHFNNRQESYREIEKYFNIWFKKGLLLNKLKFLLFLVYLSSCIIFIYKLVKITGK